MCRILILEGEFIMGYSKKYTAWTDNSDREDFYDDYGNLQTTHVDRYNLDGSYNEVYNAYDEKIDKFTK